MIHFIVGFLTYSNHYHMDHSYKDGNIHSIKQQLLKDWNFRNIKRVITWKKKRSKVVSFKNSCQLQETFDKFHVMIKLQQEFCGTAFFFMITIGKPSSSSFIGLKMLSIPSLIFPTLKQASTLFESFNKAHWLLYIQFVFKTSI